MTDMNKTLEDYEGEKIEKAIYRYLKTKHDADPETLTELEGGLLLLCSASRHLSLQERKQRYIDFYQAQYDKAKALVNRFEAGNFQGTWQEFSNGYKDLMPAVADQYVRQLDEIELLIAMNDLDARFLKLEDKHRPMRPKTSFTQKELQCINEEHAALVVAGYPADEIEEMARKRGTFKAAFGADKLPVPGITMATVNIEHNLMDFELEETLEKALKSVRLSIQRPDRKFRDPALEKIATDATRVFADQMNALVSGITEVIDG